jgi:[histone H3]-trimethyl-L-lysine9/36 demethylase
MEGEGFPTLRPTKEEFSKPFVDYVQEVFARYPGLSGFKVIPPKGYSPRRNELPKFQDVVIGTPIKQYVRNP